MYNKESFSLSLSLLLPPHRNKKMHLERGYGAWMQCTPYINIVPITRSPGGYRSWRTTTATSHELRRYRDPFSGYPAEGLGRWRSTRTRRPHETPDMSRNNLPRDSWIRWTCTLVVFVPTQSIQLTLLVIYSSRHIYYCPSNWFSMREKSICVSLCIL